MTFRSNAKGMCSVPRAAVLSLDPSGQKLISGLNRSIKTSGELKKKAKVTKERNRKKNMAPFGSQQPAVVLH